VATARFVCTRPESGGDDWISKLLSVAAPVMARREHGLPPKRVVVRVNGDRVDILHGGKEIASWHRDHLRATADGGGRRWKVWMEPPGDGYAFELQARRGGPADEVVAALVR
jgi:hypothetical protein